MLAGLAGALAALLFRLLLEQGSMLLWGGKGDVLVQAGVLPWYGVLLLTCGGGALAGVLLQQAQRRYPDQHGDYMTVLANGGHQLRPGRSMWHAASAAASIISGCAIGREGAMIQLAAQAGSQLGACLRTDAVTATQMLACAAAAGVAFAYQSPLAGALFIAEIVFRSYSPRLLLPMLLACGVAWLLERALPGPALLYALPRLPTLSLLQVLLLLPLGLVCGVFWSLMLLGLARGSKLFRPLMPYMVLRLALGGLACGVLALLTPYVLGNGSSVIQNALHAYWPALLLLQVLLCKFLAIILSSSSGAQGGLFTPTLCLGALLGGLYACLLNVFGADLPLQAALVAGMAGLLAAAIRAPLTAWVMLLEMTGDPLLALPLAMVVASAYWLAGQLGSHSLYAASLYGRG